MKTSQENNLPVIRKSKIEPRQSVEADAVMQRRQARLKFLKHMMVSLNRKLRALLCIGDKKSSHLALKLETEMITAYSMKSLFIVKIK